MFVRTFIQFWPVSCTGAVVANWWNLFRVVQHVLAKVPVRC